MIRLLPPITLLVFATCLIGCVAETDDLSSSAPSSASEASSSAASAAGDIALGRTYFMQSTTQGDTAQLPEQQVPLAAGRETFIRAFISGSGNTFDYRVRAQLHYQLANGDTGSVDLNGPFLTPRSVNELYLSETYNGILAAEVVQPGTRYYISVADSSGMNETNNSNNRYPTSGWAELPVLDIPALDLVIVPVVTKNIAPKLDDARLQELFSLTHQLYPLTGINIEIAPAITYEGESWSAMLRLVEDIQIANGETDRYYLGIAGHPLTFDTMNITAGYAYIGRKVATSLPYADTIAHELGHNFGREHAPCGDAPGADTNYPYPNAEIGVYGLGPDGLRFNDSYYDVMSYCTPVWISDYTYDAVIKHLAADAQAANKTAAPQPSDTQQKATAAGPLLVINGQLTGNLSTAHAATDASIDFIWPAAHYRTAQPSKGKYHALIRDANGAVISKQAFAPYQEDHGQGLYFTVAVAQNPNASVLQIVHNDTVLAERSIATGSNPQTLKSSNPITAQRIDEHWVTVSNITQLPAVIRDKDGHILTIARRATAKLYTQSEQLIINNQTVTISAP